jgi:hypothetical protein
MKSLAFIHDPHSLLGDAPRRPLSLGSAEVLRTLGVTVHLPGADLSVEEESRQILMYDAVHVLPAADLLRHVTLGTLRHSVSDELLAEDTVATFRHMAELQNTLLKACDFKVRLRDSEKKHREEPPGDMVYPSLLASRVARLSAQGWSRDFILWELPLSQALQLLHTSYLVEGRWTVLVGDGEVIDDGEDLAPDWMTPPAD